ncbi:YbjN domain-containing protein [Enterovibrio makurazakiensis]|uniref:YbjN domain-containing protein n=1 Tax=Enterovibrio makurazakiensis TaxID=2910232 RepID=UPI003D2368DC
MTDIIAPDRMSHEKIKEILIDANVKAEFNGDTDGFVTVTGPSGFASFITISDEHMLIKYEAVFEFREHGGIGERLELVNKLNEMVVFSRFLIPFDDDKMYSDYYISYEEGITSKQIINSMCWFDNVTWNAIATLDESNLVKVGEKSKTSSTEHFVIYAIFFIVCIIFLASYY